ncbi:MAG: MFS transporter [Acidimicrobiia bacterium]|nr:MFS transporter [Acidimicrobiia bacterium]
MKVRTHRPRPLRWLLVAEAISLTGSRISFLAVPWLVLETTGSAAKTGLVAFAEMLPYVLASALGGPIVDERGPRRMSIRADVVSFFVVAALPLLFHAHLLPLPVFIVVIAAAGAVRGFGDISKRAVFPLAVDGSDVDLTRATAMSDGVDRLSYLLGGAIGGALIAWIGAANAVFVDATTFGVGAVIVAAAVRVDRRARAEDEGAREPYLVALRAGFTYVRRDSLIFATAMIVLLTNLLDQAHLAVMVPVWVHDVAGSPAALGKVFVAFGLGAVVGNIAFTALAAKLPRAMTFRICFALSGAPHILVMAVSSSVAVVTAAIFTTGVLCASINPIFGALVYERVPSHLQARVVGVLRATSWAGMPLGGLAGGLLIAWLGLRGGLLLVGVVYLALTLIPIFSSTWRQIDRPSADETDEPVVAGAPPSALPV